MIPREFEKRPYDTFISYASEDVVVASRLFAFLKQSGMNVFFDKDRFKSGQPVVEEFAKAMAQSKSCIVLLSKHSILKDYVRHEITCAGRQAVICSGAFRFICALLESFDPSAHIEFTGNYSWLDLSGGDLSIPKARMTLLSIRRSETLPKKGQSQIYVSCSWRDHESFPRDFILNSFAKKGAFLVGDCRDQGPYEEDGINRIRRIMSSCSGLLAIYPNRIDPTKTPEENYKFFPDELALALELGIPVKGYCVDPSVLPRILSGPWTIINEQASLPDLESEIVSFLDDIGSLIPHAFLATDHKRSKERNEAARDIIEHLMGMNCTLGKEISGGGIRQRLIKAIRDSNIVIADIACSVDSKGEGLAVNINTCIEAGVAMAANKPLFITSLDPAVAGITERKMEAVPFFFRDHAIEWYMDDLSFLATIHKIARERRRRILNDEL